MYLEIFVEDASHSGEGALLLLVSDEPGFGGSQLLRVDEDEASWLGKGLQHKRRQPGRSNTIRKHLTIFIYFRAIYYEFILLVFHGTLSNLKY